MNTDVSALKGSMAALVTPMRPEGDIDFRCLTQLIGWHIDQGSDCLVVTGTTGESPTLDHEEHIDVIEHCVRAAKGRIPIIAGVGSNATREAIDLSRRACSIGADACLQVAPYYNRPPQAGLYAHFAEISRAVPGPHILYNVPARTGADILPDTVARLACLDNIIGIKEATGSAERAKELRGALKSVRPGFRLYAGDDAVALDVLACGGSGCISVTANITPRQSREVFAAALAGDFDRARELDSLLAELHQVLFVQSNPIPVKWALGAMGRIPAGIRLPLVALDDKHRPLVQGALDRAGISLTRS